MKSRSLAVAAFVLVWLPSACGPAGIGVAIGGSGGGGSGSNRPPSSSGSSAAVQPFDDMTVLQWKLAHADGHRARVKLEYTFAGQTRAIEDAHVYALERGQLGARIRFHDPARGHWLFDTAADGSARTHFVVWDHAAQIREDFPGQVGGGQAEFRSVRVDMTLGDERATALALAANPVWNGTLGRQAAVIGDLELFREDDTDGESEMIVVATLTDFGGDGDRDNLWSQTLTVEGRAVPGARFTKPARTDLDDPPDPGEPLTYTVVGRFDPLADAGLAVGSYQGEGSLDVVLRNEERFHQGTSRFPTGRPRDDNPAHELARSFPAAVGRPVVVADVELPDPDPDDPLAERRPWFVLPIKMVVSNTGSVDATIVLEGRYCVNNAVRFLPMTLVRTATGGPTATRFVLPAGTSTTRHLLWNVAHDEGLGIQLVADDPRLRRVAQVHLRASVVDAGAGHELRSPWYFDPSWDSRLNTPALVRFREQLLNPEHGYHLLVSDQDRDDADGRSARTRDMFYSRSRSDGFPGTLLGVDQRFAPNVLAGLGEVGLVCDSGCSILPTNFWNGLPDCVVELGNLPVGVPWVFPPQQLPLFGLPIHLQGTWSDPRRAPPLSRNFHVFPTTVFIRHELTPITQGANVTNGVSQAHVNVAYFQPDRDRPAWNQLYRPPIVVTECYDPGGDPLPDPIHRSRFVISHNAFPGEFDGDRSTFDIVFGSAGTEGSHAAGRRSFMDVFRLHKSELRLLGQPVRLPRVPPLSDDPARAMDGWFLRPVPDPRPLPSGPPRTGLPDLLLARSVGPTRLRPAEVVFWTLRQNRPGGGFDGRDWEPLSRLVSEVDVQGNYEVVAVEAVDLDGSTLAVAGEDRHPEVVVVLSYDAGQSFRLVMRTFGANLGRSAGPDDGFAWRELLTIDATPGHALAQPQLIDVNGDELLDFVVFEHPIGERDGQYYAYSSAFTGVAGGLGTVRNTADSAPSARPAVVDLDSDGTLDLVTGGRLHYGSPNGSFSSPNTQIFGTSPDVVNVAEQILDPFVDRDDELEVLTHTGQVAKINVLAQIGDREQVRLDRLISVRVGGRRIDTMVPFVPPAAPRGSPPRRAKDIAALLSDSPSESPRLWRIIRLDDATFAAEPRPWVDAPLTPGALVAVRRGPLLRPDPVRNRHEQDIAVASGRDVIVATERPPAGIHRIPIGEPGETVVALANGSVTDDRHDDLVVLSRLGNMLRVWCVAQDASTGFVPPAHVTLLIQHEGRDADGVPFKWFGFSFDPYAEAGAHGVLFHADRTSPSGLPNAQVRIILPTDDRDGLRGRMVRSGFEVRPGAFALGRNPSLILSDFDTDGTVEVFGAHSNPLSPKLFKLDRGYQSPR